MNVFVLPSWYPNEVNSNAGIFVREQCEALARRCVNGKVIVSTWGHDALNLPWRNPGAALAAFRRRLQLQSGRIRNVNGIWEVFNPSLTWSRFLPFGGANGLIGVNRQNLRLACEHFGRVDLIHAHVSYPAGYVASVLSREFGIPYVMTEHMSPFPFSSLMRRDRPIPQIIEAFAKSAANIAVSPSLARRISEFGLGEPSVIPNLVDEERFAKSEPTPGKFVFFTLCGLVAQKGVDQLLEAVARWNPCPDRFEFRIAGDGPMREAYQRMSERLGISDRIVWLGSVGRDMAARLFGECHVFVLPSRHETFGVVYAEATACGKPVIATRCGGPEFIVNDINGKLVDVGDVQALADAMKEIAGGWSDYDPNAIRADFLRRFSGAVVANSLLRIYRAVLARSEARV